MAPQQFTLELTNEKRLNLRRILRDELARIDRAIVGHVMEGKPAEAYRLDPMREERQRCSDLLEAVRALEATNPVV